MNIICVIFLLFLKNVNYVDNSKFETPFKYGRTYFKQIKPLCEYRDRICRTNDTSVCAVRLTENQTFIYKTFNNSCYLFFTNMCEYPGREFNIVNIGSCAEKPSRRLILPWNKTITNFVKINTSTTAKPALRHGTTEPSTLYDVDTAFDYHICPLSCPDVYSPVCVGVNRGFGMYFKFYTFINHCAGDVYYCKNWREFSPPPDEDEMVRSSPLSWSYCAANRYIQFARFAEMTSSMGHYGWLAGDYRFGLVIDATSFKTKGEEETACFLSTLTQIRNNFRFRCTVSCRFTFYVLAPHPKLNEASKSLIVF